MNLGFPRFERANLAAIWPWYTQCIRRGETLRYCDLPNRLPPEAAAEREYCMRSGLRAHLAIPFTVGGAVLGAIGFGSYRTGREWPDDLVDNLRLVGEVFANALARKRAERYESRLREQLALAARVTLVGELAASIAHEVNQPLCAIISNADALQRMLAASNQDPAEVREALEDIGRDGRRASAVIGRVRSLLRRTPAERAHVDVNDLVREVAVLVRGDMARRDVPLRLDLPEGLPPVSADRVQLQQVILNLLSNGADAMATVARGSRELVVRSALGAACGVALEVSDTGVGIPPANRSLIFETFFTTKPGGMGMGLAICKSIVEAHGGRLEALPNPGRGSTFRITLPADGEGVP
jgi:signal transduction histidine kinase